MCWECRVAIDEISPSLPRNTCNVGFALPAIGTMKKPLDITQFVGFEKRNFTVNLCSFLRVSAGQPNPTFSLGAAQ
jgi:hypothetical protein